MKIITLVAVALLAGCSATTYNKTGNADTQAQDLKVCEYEAQKAVGPKRNLTDLVMNSSRKSDVIELCMEAKGYKAE